MLGILPYSGIAFTMNEQCKNRVKNISGKEPTSIERMVCGAFSGLVAQSITYPLEVIRRRIQTLGIASDFVFERSAKTTIPNYVEYNSMKGCEKKGTVTMKNIIRSLLEEQGMKGLFKGVSMNWIKGPISIGISFTTFDYFKNFLQNDNILV